MLRREFLTLPAFAALPLVPVSWEKPYLHVHFRFEHPDGISYSEGDVSPDTFLKVAKVHPGYDLIFLKPSKCR